MKKIFYAVAAALTCFAAPSHIQADEPETRILGLAGRVYDLPVAEADAMEFLYRYMPLSDRLMYTPEFYLRNVRTSLLARREMPWGKTVPDDLWRHFVLPVRGNNEYLDDFRSHYYPELKERVKDMSMYDAALEINHWLHEKVTYKPSDSRTSAPEASIRTATGRCGEESVLGVAAFRAVGIPARQVYTPRWAHTDDNHAWVEVWVDGKWYFLGACEPEPELNRAWFNAPVSRGMLMHTRVFGDYKGPEQIMSVNGGITEINVTDNYVPVRESRVTVVSASGRPLAGVKVYYKIYNYAEFYTAGTRVTDASGTAMLLTGQGDMLAWASDGKYFGFAKVDSPQTRLVLDHKIGDVFETDIDIVPPVENPIPSHATESQIADNARRFEAENRVRGVYEATFFGGRFCGLDKSAVISAFGEKQGERVADILLKAKGNWQNIYDFLSGVEPERMDEAIGMLEAVSEKDLRDTPRYIFSATLAATEPQPDNDLYVEYVLNPRVANELLTDYRRSMRQAGKTKPMTAEEIFDYTKKNISIDQKANAYRVPIAPLNVWKAGVADAHSRDIFFVAACRNNGIPARLDPVSGLCQYYADGQWMTVNFQSGKSEIRPTGTLAAVYTASEYLPDPEYYRHFTISEICEGAPRVIEFGDDLGESYTSLLEHGTELPQGYYMLTTGVRQANGSVSARLSFFNVEKDKTLTVPLILNHKPEAIEVIGSIDPEMLYQPAGADAAASILSTTGRGYFIIGVLGDTDEPSNHAVTDLASIASTLNKWGRPIVLLSRDRDELKELSNLHYGKDIEGRVRAMLETGVKSGSGTERRLPVIMVADSFGRVVFVSEGYDTSLGQKLTNLLPQL